MANAALPADILLTIMEISSRPIISRMMRTCRVMYVLGARILINSGVSISTNEDAVSFLRFMLADPDARFPHLRSLEISRGEFSRAGVHALRGLLYHRLLALETLTLLDAETVLMSDPPKRFRADYPSLFMALASLRSLKNLNIDGCDTITLSLLRRMVAGLETVTLNLGSCTLWSNAIDLDDRNPILLLMGYSQTLQELRGSYFDSESTIVKYDVVYPAVRLISASYTSMDMPQTLAYINAFPNLEYLSLTYSSHRSEGNSVDPHSRPNIYTIRDCNIHDQENYGVTWEHLQEVTGSIMDVFILGLVCHVPTVRVLDDISERMCMFLHDVIADTKPEFLVVTVTDSSLFAAGGPMSGVLQQSAARHLRNLELELCFAPHERNADLDGIMSRIRATLGMPLRSLILTLNYGVLLTPRGTSGSSLKRPCTLESNLVNLDIAREEVLFMEAIPSLQDVSILLSKNRRPEEYMSDVVTEDDSSASSGGSSESDMDELQENLRMYLMDEEDADW